MDRYDGRRAVITGGTSGMGLATAALLADRGARVLVTGRTEAGLASARQRLGPDAIVVRSDAGSRSDIEALADRVRADLGAVDLLFLNAGGARSVPFEATPEDVYDELFAVNAKGPYFTVQKLAPLLADGSGVVLTTSVMDVKGLPHTSAYAASKAALRSMARTLARELLPRNIRVNAVSPGPIDTPILGRTMSTEAAEAARRGYRETNPMKRMGRPEEIAKAVVFLAFEATFTTGAELTVDGGAAQL